MITKFSNFEKLNETVFPIIAVALVSIFLFVFYCRGFITRKLFTRLIKKSKNADIQVREVNGIRPLMNIMNIPIASMDYLHEFVMTKEPGVIDEGPFYYICINMDEENNPNDPLGEEQWEEAMELAISLTSKKMLVKNIPADEYPKKTPMGKGVVKLSDKEFNKIIEKITPLIQ